MIENKLDILNNNEVATIGKTYLADSGFLYKVGVRNFGSLKILEEVALGTGVSFLCGIKVFDQEGTLLIDKKMKNHYYYEREEVRKVVLNELLHMLIEANKQNINFDLNEAKMKISAHLKHAYFNISYEAINKWAIELGIFKK